MKKFHKLFLPVLGLCIGAVSFSTHSIAMDDVTAQKIRFAENKLKGYKTERATEVSGTEKANQLDTKIRETQQEIADLNKGSLKAESDTKLTPKEISPKKPTS